MTPVELSSTVLRAVRRAVDEGELSVTVPERAVVTVPGPGGCGDYATNIALQLARPAGQPPRRVAEILQTRLLGSEDITDVVVTGPGFLNISLRSTSSVALVEEILRRGPRYGYADGPTGQLVQLHVPHEVRALVVADAVARLLRSQGALVRTTAEARPEPEWETVLGVRVDAFDTLDARTLSGARALSGAPAPLGARALSGARALPDAPAPVDVRALPDAPAPLDVNVRPVPAAPADPLPLGRDAARWALLHPASHDRPRVTDEHLVQRESNPLFRVRYAHARTRALTRNAADLGFTAEPGPIDPADTTSPEHTTGPEHTTKHAHTTETPATTTDPATTTHPPHTTDTRDPADTTAALLVTLADHPRVLAHAAAHRTPDRLARHLVTVADAVLPLLPAVLPRGEEKPSAAHRARLALAEAAGTVLAGGLSLLGIDAPDHL